MLVKGFDLESFCLPALICSWLFATQPITGVENP